MKKPEFTEQEANRAKAIVASLRGGEPSSVDMYEAFWELDALPADAVKNALVPWTGPVPDLAKLDNAMRAKHGLPLHPLRLQTIALDCDADILDLGPVVEEQLRIAGKTWDGIDRAPEERLDGEIEDSFAGTLERRVLADFEGPTTPLYDVLLFAGGAGVVFAAGTTRVLALIADSRVELRDRRVRSAIESVLAESVADVGPAPRPVYVRPPVRSETPRPRAVIPSPPPPTRADVAVAAPPVAPPVPISETVIAVKANAKILTPKAVAPSSPTKKAAPKKGQAMAKAAKAGKPEKTAKVGPKSVPPVPQKDAAAPVKGKAGAKKAPAAKVAKKTKTKAPANAAPAKKAVPAKAPAAKKKATATKAPPKPAPKKPAPKKPAPKKPVAPKPGPKKPAAKKKTKR